MGFADPLDPLIVGAPYLKKLAAELVLGTATSIASRSRVYQHCLSLYFTLHAWQSCWLMSLDIFFGSDSDRTSSEQRGAAIRGFAGRPGDKMTGKPAQTRSFSRFDCGRCRERTAAGIEVLASVMLFLPKPETVPKSPSHSETKIFYRIRESMVEISPTSSRMRCAHMSLQPSSSTWSSSTTLDLPFLTASSR